MKDYDKARADMEACENLHGSVPPTSTEPSCKQQRGRNRMMLDKASAAHGALKCWNSSIHGPILASAVIVERVEHRMLKVFDTWADCGVEQNRGFLMKRYEI